ncbi:MAG: carboxyl transferase domain-containing protein [Alphaproteobacteria bacterium]
MFEMGQATVPRASIVLRKGYGGGYYAMGGGQAFESDAGFAWPTAEICAMSVEGAVDVAYRRDYEGAAEGFGIDEVIDPRQTRRHLINTFDRCASRRPDKHPPRIRPISPI